jgi:hypothetical protein
MCSTQANSIIRIECAYILNPNASIITLNDAFYERFEKLSALVQISLSEGFDDCSKGTTYHYRTVMSDIVDQLKELQSEIMRKTEKEALVKLTK